MKRGRMLSPASHVRLYWVATLVVVMLAWPKASSACLAVNEWQLSPAEETVLNATGVYLAKFSHLEPMADFQVAIKLTTLETLLGEGVKHFQSWLIKFRQFTIVKNYQKQTIRAKGSGTGRNQILALWATAILLQ